MGLLDIFKKKEPATTKAENIDDAPLPPVDPLLLKLGHTQDEDGNSMGFYLPEEDRSTHLYVLGSSGVGKSKGLANWILEDIENKRGCGVIDPHGDLINDIIGNLIPANYEQVILVEMTDPEHIVGFNPLEHEGLGLRGDDD